MEPDKIHIVLLNNFLQKIDNDLQRFKRVIEVYGFIMIEIKEDVFSVDYKNGNIRFCESGLPKIFWDPIYVVQFDVLDNFIKETFVCAEKACGLVCKYGSKYCQDHHNHYSKLHGLIIPQDVITKRLEHMISEELKDKKNI